VTAHVQYVVSQQHRAVAVSNDVHIHIYCRTSSLLTCSVFAIVKVLVLLRGGLSLCLQHKSLTVVYGCACYRRNFFTFGSTHSSCHRKRSVSWKAATSAME